MQPNFGHLMKHPRDGLVRRIVARDLAQLQHPLIPKSQFRNRSTQVAFPEVHGKSQKEGNNQETPALPDARHRDLMIW